MKKRSNQVRLEDVLKFSDFLLQFQEVVRKVKIPRREAEENDAEHSYQLVMMAWYLNQAGGLNLDTDLLIRYGLVHDLPEFYAGDFHVLDHGGRAGKKEREEEALAQIAKQFPEFSDLTDYIKRYEERGDPESRFIYALDKLMPMIMIYLEGGSTWRELDFSREELLAHKEKTTAGSPEINSLARELEVLIRKHPDFFNKS